MKAVNSIITIVRVQSFVFVSLFDIRLKNLLLTMRREILLKIYLLLFLMDN